MPSIQAVRAFATGWFGVLALGAVGASLGEVLLALQAQVCTVSNASGLVHALAALPTAWPELRAPLAVLYGALASGLAGLAMLCWPGGRTRRPSGAAIERT